MVLALRGFLMVKHMLAITKKIGQMDRANIIGQMEIITKVSFLMGWGTVRDTSNKIKQELNIEGNIKTIRNVDMAK